MTLIPLDKRLNLIGPLPRDLQSYLVYAAAIMSNAPSPDAGKDFVRFLTSPASQAALAAAGWRTETGAYADNYELVIDIKKAVASRCRRPCSPRRRGDRIRQQ